MCVGDITSVGDTEGTEIAFPDFANSATAPTPIIEDSQSNLGTYRWQFLQKMFAEGHLGGSIC